MSQVGQLVGPLEEGERTGCLYCPLFPCTPAFAGRSADYQRPVKDLGHKIRTLHVADDLTPVDVLFVGEAPGMEEDKRGAPFVGPSGTILRETVKLIGRRRAFTYSCANVLACRPPLNRKPTVGETRACHPQLVREVATRQPKVLVALGATALKSLSGQSGITSLIGKSVPCTLPGCSGIPVVGCFHPAYILRNEQAFPEFRRAVDAAVNVLFRGVKVVKPIQVDVLESVDEAVAVLEAAARSKTPIAYDFETGALTWHQSEYPIILCLSLAESQDQAYVIPWEHPEWRGWEEGEYELLHAAMRAFFISNAPKLVQNGKFDNKWAKRVFGVWPRHFQDLMLLSYVQDERKGVHGLKELAKRFTDRGGYEKELEDYTIAHPEADVESGGSYALVPTSILFRYAGYDAAIMHEIWPCIERDRCFSIPQTRTLATVFMPQLSDCLAEMEYHGVKVDRTFLRAAAKKTRKKIGDLEKRIHSLPQVMMFTADRLKEEQGKRKTERGKANVRFAYNPGSNDQTAAVLFNYYRLKPVELTKMGFMSLVGGWKEGGRKGDWAKVVERAIEARKWKMFTVGADVLHDYAGAGNELATLLLEYRKYDKELGTYLEGLDECADEHGFVHGNFSIHGTVTGRLSSSKPNLQNLSGKDENVVKCAFVSRFENGVMISADLSQIELRIAACYYNDPSMQETYHKGGDIHKETAILISGLSREAYEALPDTTPDQRGKTDWRKRAKRLNFGIVYGIGADGLVGTLRKDGVHITEEQAQELIDRFFRVRPALARNIQRLMKKLDKQGYLRTFSGRWRRLPEAFSNDHEVQSRAHRQGVNFPIQDMASEMTLMSLVLIRKRLREKKLRSKLVLTIHDSIVADCPREEALTVASVMHECMERLPELSDEVFPGLDWSWLTVPVLAEVEVGHNFGVQVKLPSVLGDGPVVEDGKVMRMPNDDSELEEVLALCVA